MGPAGGKLVRARWVWSVVLSVLVAVAAFVGVVGVAHDAPIFGLDLQGGASVVYRPARPVSTGLLQETIAILRNRVDGLGIADPQIAQQGHDIVVELPGIRDPRQALAVIGQTAVLQFRPVECPFAPASAQARHAKLVIPASCPTSPAGIAAEAAIPTTPTSVALHSRTAVLDEVQGERVTGRVLVGPTLLEGNAIKSVYAAPDPNAPGFWLVNFTLTSKAAPVFDAIAKTYYQRQLAIVLDGQVISAPTITSTSFNGQGQITGNFSQAQASNLALVLRYGALPVQLVQQTVQTVSATLGQAALRAGLLAGIVGLVAVFLYTLVYYRVLGIVVLLGLAVTGAAVWSIVAYLGRQANLTLDLSGVTGLIVSIGLITDSYIVFFERLRDEVREGSSLGYAVSAGFKKAFRTIIAADLVSFIGAALLWYFSIGQVKGFAFFLGLATVADVASAWFFTRPLVLLVGAWLGPRRPRWLGVGSVQVREAVPATTILRPRARVSGGER
jgi:preprotein translocase subunit SecD